MNVNKNSAAYPSITLCASRTSALPAQDVLVQYKVQLVDDPISHTHLTALYDTLLAQNLVRLIEPFSRVEISHIATLIGLPVRLVEDKLSQVSGRWQGVWVCVQFGTSLRRDRAMSTRLQSIIRKSELFPPSPIMRNLRDLDLA